MKPKTLIAIAAAALLTGTPVNANPSGSIRGIVTDHRERTLRKATVVISSNEVDGGVVEVKTDDDGLFFVHSLPPGSYDLSIQRRRFKDVRVPDQTVMVGRTLQLSIGMERGRGVIIYQPDSWEVAR